VSETPLAAAYLAVMAAEIEVYAIDMMRTDALAWRGQPARSIAQPAWSLGGALDSILTVRGFDLIDEITQRLRSERTATIANQEIPT